MKYTEELLKKAHDRSFRNKDTIIKSINCMCFYCENIYSATDVREWVRKEETAICPICGIDSVIGDASGFPITAEFLGEMYLYWFSVRRPLK